MNRVDDPDEFHELPITEQGALVTWIHEWLKPARTYCPSTSYGLKHIFEESEDGFYVTNGQFKGALRAAGFKPRSEEAQNWEVKVKIRKEKHQ
ncbi:MAG: hypothetical protein HY914_10145 [Desulfomonile tiedjei]|nr:hypothetical protein [Desulfomonile tiedjei]